MDNIEEVKAKMVQCHKLFIELYGDNGLVGLLTSHIHVDKDFFKAITKDAVIEAEWFAKNIHLKSTVDGTTWLTVI